MSRCLHKGYPLAAMLLLATDLALPRPAAGQLDGTAAPRVGVGDAVAVAAAALLYVTPRALDWGPAPSTCAPCDRASVPSFDRWAITNSRPGWSTASSVGVLGLSGLVAFDLSRRPAGAVHVAAAAESGAWAAAAAELIKAIAGRKRPVLFTEVAPGAVDLPESRRSFPSGHTAAAFAVMMSYSLSRRTLDPGDSRATAWIALGGAVAIGAMRIAAGKHFPSDVLAGAVVGAGSAVLVHAIRF
ncbi:MAG TPA: phosphatase PAP2 family protein [Gemmatimonadales bacterium]